MKKNIFLVAIMAVSISLIFTACKSKKPISVAANSVEVSVPFSGKDYQTDKNFFRSSQSGKSPDLATAKKIALTNAKTELGGNIQAVVKAVTENYTNQRTIADRQDFENKFEENARVVVNQTLNDVKTIDEKIFREPDGKYTYWIAIEMNKNAISNSIANGFNKLSNSEKLQLDFDKHLFQKIFDEEMEKFSNK